MYRDNEDGLIVERKQELEVDGVEVICVKVSTSSKNSFILVTAYVPPEKKDQMEGLLLVLDKCKQFKHLILTGDLNAKSMAWNNRKANSCGRVLEDYMLQNDLVSLNDGLPTRRNSDSVIDLVIVKPKVVPEVALCETLTAEYIRSDHIGVLLDVYQQSKTAYPQVEKFKISKIDWDVWNEVSEEKFKEWNESNVEYQSVEEMTEAFMEVYTDCLTCAVPKEVTKWQSKRKKPPWWNDDVREAKREWNKAKKDFKRRRMPCMLENLRKCESAFEEVREEAKQVWSEDMCSRISNATSAKDMWNTIHSFTSYQESNVGGVLPLVDEDKNPVFEKEDKCDLLQRVFFGGSHLDNCRFEEGFKRDIEEEVKQLERGDVAASQVNEERCEEFLNYEISVEEVEAVLQQLKDKKAPGPDIIYSEILKRAGCELQKAVLHLFQFSWQLAVVPKQWKAAEVKFLRKSGKKSYHDPGAYRPISLTSFLCKCLERIITYRLYGFVEHFNILDQDQEGFRKFRSTTDALLRFTQDIYQGFNGKEHTAALFVDVEKAYDSVWREGLLFKIWSMGITGRIWMWIKSFLEERTVSIYMSGTSAPYFQTYLGLPQGSVISPLLFNLFIADWYKELECERVKFADDGTIWKRGPRWQDLVASLQLDFKKLLQWSNRWRLKLSLVKTEFCIFSKDQVVLEEARQYRFDVEGHLLQYNSCPKLLGVHLDEKLTFSRHMETVERKSLRTLELLRRIQVTEKISTDCMLQLYKAMVAPQLEYAVAVWQIGNCSCLEKVQRKGLAICLGTPGMAGIDALEVEAGVKPLDLRREELAIRQAVKVLMKDDSNVLKTKWNVFSAEENQHEQRVSPFGQMTIQLADMVTNTGISLHSVEKELNFQESLQPSRRPPEYWHSLGSSKCRSTEQEEESRRVINQMMDKCSPGTAVAFTDGSCLGNPGPCGAGACIFVPGNDEPVLLKQPVSGRGSILLGELIAIKMTLIYIQDACRAKPPDQKKIQIFSDSQSAIGLLTLGWEADSQKATIQECKAAMKSIIGAGFEVALSWSPGHADIGGNEKADQLAKEAAKEARDIGDDLPAVTTLGDVKTAAKKSVEMKWQDRWCRAETGRCLFQFRPKVGFKLKHKFQLPFMARVITQLRTGYSSLNEYKQKTGASESDECRCGGRETVRHFLLECQLMENEREQMRRRLFQFCGIMNLDLNTLLDAKSDDVHKGWRSLILQELESYVANSKRFAAAQ